MPILLERYDNLYGRMVNGNNSPLSRVNNVLFVSGHIIGTLNKELLETPLEDEAEILIVVPDAHTVFDRSVVTGSIFATPRKQQHQQQKTPQSRTIERRPLETMQPPLSPSPSKRPKLFRDPTATQHIEITVSTTNNNQRAVLATQKRPTNVEIVAEGTAEATEGNHTVSTTP